jgi:hypothetical protein
MYQRTCHWSTIDLIYQLTSISIHESSSNVLQTPTNRTILDERLAFLLKDMTPFQISQIMRHYPGSTVSSLPLLLQRCQTEKAWLYDNTTAAEYHSLLCATLVAFAKALSELSDAIQQESDTENIRKQVAMRAAFLNTVVLSTAFMQHTQYLADLNVLQKPIQECHGIVTIFAEANNITIWQKIANDKEPDDDDDSEEFPLPKGPKLRIHHLRSWIKLLVEHLTAARILQHHCSKLGAGGAINIDVVVIQPPARPSHPKVNWEDMKTLITKLNDDSSTSPHSADWVDYTTAIPKLEEYAEHAKGTSKSLRDLRNLIVKKQSITLHAKYHCEMLLLALFKFPDRSMEAIGNVLQVCRMFYVLIGGFSDSFHPAVG